eukprot:3250666-Amphidinium_carterae.1
MMFCPVYPVREKGTDVVNLLVWLSGDEFDWLQQEEEFLQSWIRALRPELIKTKDINGLATGRRGRSSEVSNGPDASDTLSVVGDSLTLCGIDSGSICPEGSTTSQGPLVGRAAVSRIPQRISMISEENLDNSFEL